MKKRCLSKLYGIKGKYEDGIKLCKELDSKYPQYKFQIAKFKCEFLLKLKLYTEAKENYQALILEDSSDWIVAGLANSLINLGDVDVAEELLANFSKEIKSSPIYFEIGNLHLSKGDTKAALAYINRASEISNEDVTKYIILSNLNLSIGKNKEALNHFRTFCRKSHGTYRENNNSEIQLIRLELFNVDLNDIKANANLDAIGNKLIALKKRKDSSDIRQSINLCTAHLALLGGKYNKANSILSSIVSDNSFVDFYNCYHMAFLLTVMSLDNEFSKAAVKCHNFINEKDDIELIYRSKVALINTLVSNHKEKSSKLRLLKSEISEANNQNDKPSAINAYIKVMELSPTLKKPPYLILNLLTDTWPIDKTAAQVRRLAKNCKLATLELYKDDDTISEVKIIDLYKSALKNINEESKEHYQQVKTTG